MPTLGRVLLLSCNERPKRLRQTRKGPTALADEIGVDVGLGPRHRGIRPLGNAMPLEAVLFTEERE